jgi:catechol 2,3-dioxygenase-like lactoylglutathione lyase family enzyme
MGIQLETVGLIVDDMAHSLAFYRHLGLEIPPEADGEDHVELADYGGRHLAWDTVTIIKLADPTWNGAAGRVGLAFACTTAAEVNAVYAKLEALGFGHNPPWDAPWGQRYARLRDPDGNRVELFAPLAGNES